MITINNPHKMGGRTDADPQPVEFTVMKAIPHPMRLNEKTCICGIKFMLT